MQPLHWGPGHRLGRVVFTPNARNRVPENAAATALLRHAQVASGEAPPSRSPGRTRSRLAGCRLLTVCQFGGGPCFWIISEADRRLTTVLMPEDYPPTTTPLGPTGKTP